ncbi:conserved hypothetical protein [uncultured Gammaproteobacteria bacterium]
MRSHWANCITNFGADVDRFIEYYFVDSSRQVLLVAAAGFDPRSRRIAQLLSTTLGDRLSALFIREERQGPSAELRAQADENERALREIVRTCTIGDVAIFADDGAPVGGSRISKLLDTNPVADNVTDVVLDLSALSIGVGFPAAQILIEDCEAATNRAFHVMVVSNPELEDRISGVPCSRSSPVKGFSPPIDADGEHHLAQIWIPQLARGRLSALTQIGNAIGTCYKICPLLPFPAHNPRRADDLLSEYRTTLVDDWFVDPRDIVYASEHNPLDCYRTLATLKKRFDRAMTGTYEPRIVLSPGGGKVLSVGALMAAIEHRMAVQYVETETYSFCASPTPPNAAHDRLVHLILSGPIYNSYSER